MTGFHVPRLALSLLCRQGLSSLSDALLSPPQRWDFSITEVELYSYRPHFFRLSIGHLLLPKLVHSNLLHVLGMVTWALAGHRRS